MERKKILYMTEIAILSAIILLMQFTPLGYFRTGALSITFQSIPVVIGSIVIGPGAGAILGGVFGVTSFLQAFLGDPLGTTFFAINPWFYGIMCIVPRVLMGFGAGLIYKGVKRFSDSILPYLAASFSGAALNTIFFMSAFYFLFSTTPEFIAIVGADFGIYLVSFVLLNAVVEAVVCCIVGTAVAKLIYKAVNAKALF